jgi:hypothetical protein
MTRKVIHFIPDFLNLMAWLFRSFETSPKNKSMFSFKNLSIGVLLTGVLMLPACSSAQITDLLKQVSSNPSTAEISSGIKEALEKGTGISAGRLSFENGYLGNLDVKILFPEEAKNVESTLRSLGLGSMCDQVITSLNRAAEDAAIAAKPIFTDAIKQMSFQDVQQVLLGEKNAATMYFKGSTTSSLTDKFAPIIDTSLKKVDATKYWSDVMTRYNKVPFVKKVDTDLTAYVTQKAIDGLFIEIAKEELKIRENIAARTRKSLAMQSGRKAGSRKVGGLEVGRFGS